LLAHIQDLVARDVKIAYLKNLQGWLWIRGYESGAIRCPLFPDVYPAFKRWKEAGIDIQIYSSGSVPAQKLLFQYTTDGDLREQVSGWWDTVNAGMKMEKASYDTIAAAREGVEKSDWLFLSDRVEEVEAAKAAGMRSRVVVREGNAPVSPEVLEMHDAIRDFGELKFNIV
jgi:enolase-phosphatase E1